MKRLLNFSLIAILAVVVLASCSKNRDYYQNDYETASVVDYENGTPYSIIQYHADNTYAIIESRDTNTQLWPDRGEILEGVFIEGRQSRVYNRTGGFNANIYVVENITSRDEAYDALYYYNDNYGFVRTIDKISFKNRTIPKSQAGQAGRVNIK
ncbi:MAG: hypothetical protein BGN92_12035 [Sphingobacteriales bacterium 41-5]|mgnify:CR=1 FL=1|nr:MAG: hypothetical protein BGN92_12035 [Sphingobacteriales bacterium 41-5]